MEHTTHIREDERDIKFYNTTIGNLKPAIDIVHVLTGKHVAYDSVYLHIGKRGTGKQVAMNACEIFVPLSQKSIDQLSVSHGTFKRS